MSPPLLILHFIKMFGGNHNSPVEHFNKLYCKGGYFVKMKNKVASFKYKRNKRKQERELEKINHRQEELDIIYKKEKQKSDFKNLLSRLKFETYTKRLVAIVVFIALIDLQLSYVLAFMGMTQIAEALSIQICVTLLGTIIVYVIRAHFDTKAEKNNELIKSGYINPNNKNNPISMDVIKNAIQEVINSSGVSKHVNIDEITNLEPENPDDSDACG